MEHNSDRRITKAPVLFGIPIFTARDLSKEEGPDTHDILRRMLQDYSIVTNKIWRRHLQRSSFDGANPAGLKAFTKWVGQYAGGLDPLQLQAVEMLAKPMGPMQGVTGPPGTGKTHLAAVIAVASWVCGRKVLFVAFNSDTVKRVAGIVNEIWQKMPQEFKKGRNLNGLLLGEPREFFHGMLTHPPDHSSDYPVAFSLEHRVKELMKLDNEAAEAERDRALAAAQCSQWTDEEIRHAKADPSCNMTNEEEEFLLQKPLSNAEIVDHVGSTSSRNPSLRFGQLRAKLYGQEIDFDSLVVWQNELESQTTRLLAKSDIIFTNYVQALPSRLAHTFSPYILIVDEASAIPPVRFSAMHGFHLPILTFRFDNTDISYA